MQEPKSKSMSFYAIYWTVSLPIVLYITSPGLYLLNPWLYILTAILAIIAAVPRFLTREQYDPLGPNKDWAWAIMAGVPLSLSVLMMIITSLSAFYPGGGDKLGQVFGTPTEIRDNKLPDLDIKNAPLVPYSLAVLKAQAALSSLGSKASQLQLGKLNKQEVNGKLVWVGFLQPAGFFQWFRLEGSPGYVVVSATDYSDAKVVTQLDSKDLSLVYTPGAYFNKEAHRHVWLNRLKDSRITDFRPEIDDEGKPYYVATALKHTVGAFGFVAKDLVILDPQTGDIQTYGLDEAPAWVDIIQTDSLISGQIDLAGEFVHGRFNFSKQDQFEISSFDQVFTKDGQSWWVAGITNVANATGVQRFIFVNTRSKESFSYAVNGVLEDRARQIVLDSHTKVYEASNAIPFMVNNRPTYVMSLSLGDAIYAYGMVDIEAETVFASKPTLSDTLQGYLAARTKSGLPEDENAAHIQYAGKVFRIGQESNTGTFKFKLSGQSATFLAFPNLSHELALTQEGDEIVASGKSFKDDEISLTQFENLTIKSNSTGAE